jgi:hypothetical protein
MVVESPIDLGGSTAMEWSSVAAGVYFDSSNRQTVVFICGGILVYLESSVHKLETN